MNEDSTVLDWQPHFKEGGYHSGTGINGPENAIAIRELDLDDEVVLDIILNDVNEGHRRGYFTVKTRYKGKNPGRWMDLLYPRPLDPKIFGIFSKGGKYCGWFSTVLGLIDRRNVGFGILIKPGCQEKRIGIAIIKYFMNNIDHVYPGLCVKGFHILTGMANTRMQALAENLNFSFIEELESVFNPVTKQMVYYKERDISRREVII